jgi:hypothetical protein
VTTRPVRIAVVSNAASGAFLDRSDAHAALPRLLTEADFEAAFIPAEAIRVVAPAVADQGAE